MNRDDPALLWHNRPLSAASDQPRSLLRRRDSDTSAFKKETRFDPVRPPLLNIYYSFGVQVSTLDLLNVTNPLGLDNE